MTGPRVDDLAEPLDEPKLVGQIEERHRLAQRERMLWIGRRSADIDGARPRDRPDEIGDQALVRQFDWRHRFGSPSLPPALSAGLGPVYHRTARPAQHETEP